MGSLRLTTLGDIDSGEKALWLCQYNPRSASGLRRTQKHNASDVLCPSDGIYFVDKYPHLMEKALPGGIIVDHATFRGR